MSTAAKTQDMAVAQRHSHRAGLRTVASVEALKGVLALTVAYILTRAIRHDYDFEVLAQRIFGALHIGLHHGWSQHVLHSADRISDWHPAAIMGLAGAYATLRFIEAYGLWRQRVWAEWLAIISGAVYIPLELERLIRRPTAFHWGILLINLAVVFYIAWVRWDEIKARRATER